MLDGGGEKEEIAGADGLGPGAAAHLASAAEEVVDLLDVGVDVALVGASGGDAVAEYELEAALEGESLGVEDAADFEVTSGGGFVDGGFGGDDEAVSVWQAVSP